MHIYVIRHGETSYNQQYLFQGRSDIPLNESGVSLALETGKAMQGLHFDICFTSPLIRAKQTASLLLEASGNAQTPIVEEARIIELNLGKWEGLCIRPPHCEVPQEAFALFRTNPFRMPPIPEGETAEEVCRRTQAFLQELVTQNYENVLVSTHGFATRAMLNRLYEHSEDFWQGCVPLNCAVNILEAEGGHVRLIEKDKLYYDPSLAVDRFK